MALDKSDLMKLPKEDLADGVTRGIRNVARYKAKAAKAAEDVMELALAGGAAFGTGYWIGNIKGASEVAGESEEDREAALKLFGMDKDLVVGIGLAAVGLTGMGGKKMSAAAKAAGNGVLAYWAGSAGERMAIERALTAK